MPVLLQCSFADVRFGSKASVFTASSLMSGFAGKAVGMAFTVIGDAILEPLGAHGLAQIADQVAHGPLLSGGPWSQLVIP